MKSFTCAESENYQIFRRGYVIQARNETEAATIFYRKHLVLRNADVLVWPTGLDSSPVVVRCELIPIRSPKSGEQSTREGTIMSNETKNSNENFANERLLSHENVDFDEALRLRLDALRFDRRSTSGAESNIEAERKTIEAIKIYENAMAEVETAIIARYRELGMSEFADALQIGDFAILAI